MGIALGLCLSAGFGMVLLDNVAIGIPIGLVLGPLIGNALSNKRHV